MRPAARTSGLVAREIDGELVVYDLERHRAHNLNRTSAFLWRRCDGRRTVGRLARELGDELGLEEAGDVARLGLRQLSRAHLLEQPFEPSVRPPTRRRLLRRLGVAGGIVALLPLVTSIVAPTPAMAQTCLPKNATCTSSAQCCSGCCGPSGKCKNGGACI